MRYRGGRGRLTIGIVVRVNDAAGGVEVGESALIRAVKRGGTLLDNESLLGWLKGSGLGGRIFGVGIGTADRTVWLYTTGTMNETTPTPDGVFLLMSIGGHLVRLPCGCEESVSLRVINRSVRLSTLTGWRLKWELLWDGGEGSPWREIADQDCSPSQQCDRRSPWRQCWGAVTLYPFILPQSIEPPLLLWVPDKEFLHDPL